MTLAAAIKLAIKPVIKKGDEFFSPLFAFSDSPGFLVFNWFPGSYLEMQAGKLPHPLGQSRG